MNIILSIISGKILNEANIELLRAQYAQPQVFLKSKTKVEPGGRDSCLPRAGITPAIWFVLPIY